MTIRYFCNSSGFAARKHSVWLLTAVFFLLFFAEKQSYGQAVYQHISNTAIYDFLDELANAQVINLNTAVKPYSRMLIAEKLSEAVGKKATLNSRMKEELDFYLRDYNKELMPDKNFEKRLDLFYYKDTLFTLSVNPIIGLQLFSNDSIDMMYHRWNGAEAFAYAGKHVGFYASLRDNRENKRLASPQYLNQFQGAEYKVDGVTQAGDYSEMRGGMTYSWQWGSIGLVKDNFSWGDNYHGSNIFSGHAPSFTHLRFHIQPVRWFDFNYVHGWLVSNVIDSANSYLNNPGYRLVFHPKYLAANLLTVTPFKNLMVSIGNSIIYSDKNVQPAYLVPFFFYKSVDHSQSSAGSNWLGENSQMFFNISSRQIMNVHLYASVFIDEISFSNAFDEKSQSNFISAKAGAHLTNFLIPGISATMEYTRTNPVVYRHYVKTSTFESNGYNLGHFLGDNSQEIYVAAGYKPIKNLSAEVFYSIAQKGEEYPYTAQVGIGSGKGNPFIRYVFWQASETGLQISYQVIHDCYLAGSIVRSDHHGIADPIYSQPYFMGKQTTLSLRANIGF